jgi:UDP-2,3-diacylglucosamine pyrophosphatase LpxH
LTLLLGAASKLAFFWITGIGVAVADAAPVASAPSAASNRTAVFVSDLHLGVGKDPDNPNQWHETEDFRWHAEFAAFLQEIDASESGRVDLVLVGDVLELWQTLKDDTSCQHGSDAGCNEQEAKARTRRVIDQHAAVFDALGAFVSQENENRITIVPGNHDVALAFASVRHMVLDAIDASPAERVTIALEGYWISQDGHVVAEHGQQVGRDPNAFRGWPSAPFVNLKGARHLHQTWGENFVQRMFNRYEEHYPLIDNLASESLGVKYAMKHLGFRASVEEVGRFAQFLLFQQSWLQAKQFAGGDAAGLPEWNLEEIDQSTSEARWKFIAGSIGRDDPLAQELDAMAAELPFIGLLSQEQLRAACERRLTLRANGGSTAAEACPQSGVLGSVSEGVSAMIFSGTQARAYRERLISIRERIGARSVPFATYVYGHTHHEHVACSPFATDADWQPRVINDGAWQRTASEEVFCTLVENRDPKEVLKKLRPEDLPACYPFVRIRGSADPQLRYWVQPQGAEGSVQSSCTDATVSHACKARPADACPAHPNRSRVR